MLNWFLSLFKKYRDGESRVGRINWHLDHQRYTVALCGGNEIVTAYNVNDHEEVIPRGSAVTLIHQNDTWYFHVPVWL